MQKSKKKKKKKEKFLMGRFPLRFSLAVFLFPVTKRAEKVSGFVFFRERRGKKMIRKCFGGNEKEWRKIKVILRNRC